MAEHAAAVEWHRYSAPEPIWAQPEFVRLPRDTRQRLLIAAVDRLRAAARPRLEPHAYLLQQQLDPGSPASSSDPELAARWLAGACIDAEPSDAHERWQVAARLWGPAGLALLREAMALPVDV